MFEYLKYNLILDYKSFHSGGLWSLLTFFLDINVTEKELNSLLTFKGGKDNNSLCKPMNDSS